MVFLFKGKARMVMLEKQTKKILNKNHARNSLKFQKLSYDILTCVCFYDRNQSVLNAGLREG